MRAAGTGLRQRVGFNFYDIFVLLVCVAFAALCFYPLWYVLLGSITPYPRFSKQVFPVLPTFPLDLSYYRAILTTGIFYNAMAVSFGKALVGSAVSVLLTTTLAYAASKVHVKGMKTVNALVVFTMFFSGGLIPSYLLIRNLGMLHTIWAQTVPWFLNAMSYVIVRNFYTYAIPAELEDAARMDGANDVKTFFRIILPLSKPTLAAIFLFDAVFFWNDWYSYLIYGQKAVALKPVVWILRELLIDPTMAAAGAGSGGNVLAMSRLLDSFPPLGLKMTTMILAMLPIMLFYPLVQKYFVKGILLGAVKG